MRLGYVFRAAAKPSVPALVKTIFDEDVDVRSRAAEALGRIGPDAGKAVPGLIAALADENGEDHLQSAAADALGQIGPEAKSAVPILRQRLKHPDSYVRVLAALALWQIGKDDVGLSTAIAALEDRRARVRVCAAEALWHMRQDRQAIVTLLGVLRDRGIGDSASANNERYMAARALGRIGRPAKAAIADLLELLDEEDAGLRTIAAEALHQIDPKAAPKEGIP